MIVIVKEVRFAMAWTIFEVLINCFQGFMIVFYVKHCFPYSRPCRIADSLLFASCGLFLSLCLFTKSISFSQNILFLFPLIHVFSLSVEPKSSAVYWLFILALVFNLITAIDISVFRFTAGSFSLSICFYIFGKSTVYCFNKCAPVYYIVFNYPLKKTLPFSPHIHICNFYSYIRRYSCY